MDAAVEDDAGAVPADTPLTDEDFLEVLELARFGELDDLLAYLSAPNACVDFVRPLDGSTALHMAAANGHAGVVAALLARGARLLPNHAGNTPLHWACLNGHEAVVAALLEAPGADVYAKNVAGKSAFTVAISAGHDALARTLLQHQSAEPPRGGGGGGGSGGGGALEEEEDGELDEEGEADLLPAVEGGGGGGGGSSGGGEEGMA